MTTPYYEDATVQLHHGDCLDVLRGLPDNSVDSICTDPPYGLGFMGKEWDDLPPGLPWARECLRVLKPGGHLLAFGGTRTWHRLACAVEDAGFEVRDSIAWMYGSGFPKSLRVSRDERYCHCDATADTSSHTSLAPPTDDHTRTAYASASAEGEARSATHATSEPLGSPGGCRLGPDSGDGLPRPAGASAPASPQPQGCAQARSRSAGTEDGPVAGSSRTPSLAPHIGHPSSPGFDLLESSPTGEQTRKLGSTSRADTSEWADRTPGNLLGSSSSYGTGFPVCTRCGKPNVDGLGTALKPAFEPVVVARKPLSGTVASNVLAWGTGALNVGACRIGTEGGRTVHTRSAGTDRDRWEGNQWTGEVTQNGGRWPANVVLDESQAAELDQMSGVLTSGNLNAGHKQGQGRHTEEGGYVGGGIIERDYGGDQGGASRFFYVAKADAGERVRVAGIAHPTVKPLALMRWLVRLVTPPGGTVLEPFAGSGTTVEACILEGFHCLAIEREADYLPLIVQRINRRRDPVAAVIAQGDDAGLFDLLDGEPA